MEIYRNVYEWTVPKRFIRAVFMCKDGCGCLIVEIHEGEKPYLYGLNVNASVRRRGLATALMDAAENWCMSQGYKSAVLYYSNEESPYWVFDWYARRGYEKKRLANKCALMEKKL